MRNAARDSIPMKSFPTLLLLLVTALPLALLSQSLEPQFDALMQAEWPADGSGATALVAVEGHIVYHKAFGQATGAQALGDGGFCRLGQAIGQA